MEMAIVIRWFYVKCGADLERKCLRALPTLRLYRLRGGKGSRLILRVVHP